MLGDYPRSAAITVPALINPLSVPFPLPRPLRSDVLLREVAGTTIWKRQVIAQRTQ